jgi:hypothetical protein
LVTVHHNLNYIRLQLPYFSEFTKTSQKPVLTGVNQFSVQWKSLINEAYKSTKVTTKIDTNVINYKLGDELEGVRGWGRVFIYLHGPFGLICLGLVQANEPATCVFGCIYTSYTG